MHSIISLLDALIKIEALAAAAGYLAPNGDEGEAKHRLLEIIEVTAKEAQVGNKGGGHVEAS
ncbi:hypothetical protein [Serratia fonticola]|uniref:hypothetical protein n=1 Tax=Serratia fonticola TaxID=47917 RepID=UPI001C47B8FC|nr:hypothetical protein [Serratia fonticola]QXN62806.1 hypothetical protein J8M99_01650 [Serratia fonticola]